MLKWLTENTNKSLRKEVFTLLEGTVIIHCPDQLSDPSLKDLQQYLEIFVRKMQRLNSHDDPHDPVLAVESTRFMRRENAD
jgi:hypothetical protein